jgi:C_GCAxxG_C_C family probable redox protein
MADDRVQQADSLFQGGLSCSQSILATYGPLFGFDYNDAIRIARGFGGGMGRLSETCGAVTGAFMVLSLKYSGADRQTKEDTYALMQEFSRKFKAEHGSLNCGQLLGCDLNTAEGQASFRNSGMMKTHCIPYVRLSAEILEGLLSLDEIEQTISP